MEGEGENMRYNIVVAVETLAVVVVVVRWHPGFC